MVNNFSESFWKRQSPSLNLEELGNRCVIVNKIAGNTFRSLKKYEKKTGTMLYNVIVD